MRLSMTRTLIDARQSLSRFPLVIICSMVAAGTGIHLSGGSHEGGPILHLFLMAVLGIPLFLTLALAVDKATIRFGRKTLVMAAGLLVLVLYSLILPETLPKSETIRFFILLFAAHFMVAVAPFLFQNSEKALWQFNKDLLLRLVSSVLFTLVMYAGLSLALAALDNLLNVSMPHEVYFKLFIFLAFVFNTWYFLAGIPETPLEPADENDFPRPLRVFAQYILATLVVVYLAILLAYLGKVILTGVWPSGWIGWLVSGVAVAGLLSMVLLSPLQDRDTDRWVRVYFKIFQILMLPSVVMLVLAVSKRIHQYGLTELRYLLLVLSGWLVLVLLSGLWAKRISVRLIPLSLGLLALAISLGPLGAVSMSLRSQSQRLEAELTTAGLLVDGHFVAAQTDSVPVDEANIIDSIWYMVKNFGFGSIEKWLTPQMNEELASVSADGELKYFSNTDKINLIADELNVPRLWEPATNRLLHYALEEDGRSGAVALDDFQYGLALDSPVGNMQEFSWDGVEATAGISGNGTELVINKEAQLLLAIPLRELFKDLPGSDDAPSGMQLMDLDEMTFDYGNDKLKVRLIVHSVMFQGNSPQHSVLSLKGWLLLRPE